MVCPTPVAVGLRDVSAVYGATTALRQVNADIPAHRVTALVGPNGSGKSTLLGVIAGVHSPASGTVRRAHDEHPALVVQRSAAPDRLPVTVRDTVAMGRWAHLGAWRRPKAADRALIDACMERLGISALASRTLGSLSGGQRQRALLAQGLAQQSDLLLLDEPAAGLDPDAQTAITDLLAEVSAGGVTVIHATHDTDAALRADHRILIGNGRIVATNADADPAAAPHPVH
ncbi:zinc/manganese transport system ATP-binding protein [Lipingzhangella halophila]|uniref:Zinc/manganese transport system ATP-binding protein n=1 Tax=Lipingzhangella halophila TaxID=1783352 RepID=A0A7W7REK5_9ACTN|nr:zinc ABC transporter ATP-binding protein AztA [Lipingzhangella halophila]MBB4930559.1 zinc/manganese transport system ATP-binding protein [Lipingzhangella halophila]